jgi:hypothetical protein
MLGNLFNKYGCDKTKKHKYDRIYEPILTKYKDKEINILEIGVFNGHSTEAFHEFFPKAKLFGIDIFERTRAEDLPCYQKDRTHYLKASSIEPSVHQKFIEKFGTSVKFDIIIDDGLHTPMANMLTFRYLSKLLKDDGHFFIEDVFPLESMTAKELKHPWLQRYPDRYNDSDNNLFLKEIQDSGMTITRFDNRKLTGEPDSYIIELVKESKL